MILQQKCDDVLKSNYLPYAMAVIIARAIPNIDGFKPVHRRVLYTMMLMKLFGDRTKSTNVIGQTMKFHPNGDSSIYDAMIRMTGNVNDRQKGHNALLFPFIDGKGNFGKAYSSAIEPAAPRYTEVRLHSWTKELLFDGLDENAVDMIDNFDGKFKEPLLLPVKFPNILVNTAPGVAVGMSSNIPSYNLKEVCEATRAVIDGSAKSIEDLAKIMLAPDFPMGGIIHNNGTTLLDALDKKGTIYTGSKMSIQGNRLNISELPYQVKVEAVVKKVTELVKLGEFPDITDIQDLSDINGFRLAIDFKNKNCVANNIDNLMRYGKLRSSVSYTSRCIINGEPRLLDVYEILNEWLDFRVNTLDRIYKFRVDKGLAKEVQYSAWAVIRDHMKEVADIMTSMNEQQAKQTLMSKFKLSEEQVNSLIDSRIRDLTVDNADKKLKILDEIRKELNKNKEMVSSKDKKLSQIYDELGEIAKKYGVPRSTIIGPEVDLTRPKKVKEVIEEVIDSSPVVVVTTSDGFLKKFRNPESEVLFNDYLGNETITRRFECSNADKILVFTYDGTCHCIAVNDIDESTGDRKMSLQKYVGDSKILYITNGGDYKKTIYVVLSNGKGVAVPLNRVAGGRDMYRGLYPAAHVGFMWVTESPKFFYVANNNRACYVDLSNLNHSDYNTWTFKICRVTPSDFIRGILSTEYIAYFEEDIEPECYIYQKGYLVKIKHDIFKRREETVTVAPVEQQDNGEHEEDIDVGVEDDEDSDDDEVYII